MATGNLNRKAERFFDQALLIALGALCNRRLAPTFVAHLAGEYADAAVRERFMRRSRTVAKSAKRITRGGRP